MRRLLTVIAVLAIVTSATAAPAVAGQTIPIRGTFDTEDVSRRCSFPACFIVTQSIDTNLGRVTVTDELSSTRVFRGNGGFHFQALGTWAWDFENGNTLITQVTGFVSVRSGIVQIHIQVIGGTGIYQDATGTIQIHIEEIGRTGIYGGAPGTSHFSQLGPKQSAFAPLGGFIAGVIRLK